MPCFYGNVRRNLRLVLRAKSNFFSRRHRRAALRRRRRRRRSSKVVMSGRRFLAEIGQRRAINRHYLLPTEERIVLITIWN